MIFNSLTFLIFWFFFTLFLLFAKSKNTKYWLISSFSLLFYGYWKYEYTILILISGLIDFYCAHKIYQTPKYKNFFLYLSVTTNLGILFSFKYIKFFINTLNEIFKLIDIDIFIEKNLSTGYFSILPIGISFYTFQSLSYTIDTYRGQLRPTTNFLKFFSYLSMFPQLVAGPIVRARDILDQLKMAKLQKGDELYYSIKLIIYGFFKKTVIADGIASYVNIAFVTPQHNDSCLYWWSVATAFAIQIYCDFSGYSDIARGLARMYGIHFPLNFNHPYTATSFKDFWNRWHISLSTWFRDYVYIPLGGGKKNRFRSNINMWITMLISGIWHGANYTFIIWGCLHAIFLTLEREAKHIHLTIPKPIKRIIVLGCVLVAWIYFRSENLTQANFIVKKMLSFKGNQITIDNNFLTILIVMFSRELYISLNINKTKIRSKLNRIEPIWLGVMASMCIFLRGDGNTFIYFQF